MVYLTQRKLAEQMGVCIDTVRDRAKEMREQQGKRYRTPVVIDDGNIVLINQIAYADWCNVRSRVKKKIKVSPYDPVAMAEEMGLTERGNENEKNTDDIVQAVLGKLDDILRTGIAGTRR